MLVDGREQPRDRPECGPRSSVAAGRSTERTRALPAPQVGHSAAAGGLGQAVAVRAEPAAKLQDSLTIANNAFARLFDGIRLAPSTESRARAVVLREAAVGLHIMYDRSASPWDGYRRVNTMLAERDAGLLALLPNAADSARYRVNAAMLH